MNPNDSNSLERAMDNDRASSMNIPDAEQVAERERVIKLRDAADTAIVSAFTTANFDNELGSMSLDRIMIECRQLKAVKEYLDAADELSIKIHKMLIRNTISRCIKAYIDGNLAPINREGRL